MHLIEDADYGTLTPVAFRRHRPAVAVHCERGRSDQEDPAPRTSEWKCEEPPRTSAVVGHAYVNDNTPGVNTVAVFDRHADGSLTPVAGSPFAIGGEGTGAGLGSQGAIQLSPNRRFLLAVDAGSNQISVLRITARGIPEPVGEPVSSGGVQPVSIAINRLGLVYVANVGDGGSNYTGFFLTPAGRLIPLPGTTFPVPEGSVVGDVLFNSTGDRLVGTRDNPSLIDSFTVRLDGRLVAAPGSPFTGQGLGQIGAEFRPTNPSQLYVSNAHNGPGLGTVSAFRVSRSGVLSSIGDSPVPTARQHRAGSRSAATGSTCLRSTPARPIFRDMPLPATARCR